VRPNRRKRGSDYDEEIINSPSDCPMLKGIDTAEHIIETSMKKLSPGYSQYILLETGMKTRSSICIDTVRLNWYVDCECLVPGQSLRRKHLVDGPDRKEI
jgi:hypothetical protein